MAAVLYCDPGDLGRVPKVWCAGELGSESPLEFVDGHATVEDDDAAALLVRRRSAIHFAGSHPDGDPTFFEDAESGDLTQATDEPDETYTCDYPTDRNGLCGRTVDAADERCWQHADGD